MTPVIYQMNYLPEEDITLCDNHFAPVFDEHLDYDWDGDNYQYCGIPYWEADEDEPCKVCKAIAQKKASKL